MTKKAQNVGILAMELYVPAEYVDQRHLEEFDNVSRGKYTSGLGQRKMGVCSDREDINSLCLTVLHKLIEKYNINLHDIGHLEVGTETIIDKSKSVKTILMALFAEAGVTDVEGIDTTNACYGGTAAVFNAINWVESSSWDGRKAIVIAADIAVYNQGPARPTGGAGAIAILIGADAPLVFDCGVRASYMIDAYDFYKPDLASEFPFVDGELSIKCYLSALDSCYNLYCKKMKKVNPSFKGLMSFDGMLFHSPYCKLVRKSVARICFNDFLNASEEQRNKQFAELSQYKNFTREKSYFDKGLEKAFIKYSEEIFKMKTASSLKIARENGNMYTASLYGCLISHLVSSKSVESLIGKKIGMFSYGSGLASTMYSITVCSDANRNARLDNLITSLRSSVSLLDSRECITPEKFTEMINIRTSNYLIAPYVPSGSTDILFQGTYYLTEIDNKRRRRYIRKNDKRGMFKLFCGDFSGEICFRS